MPRTFFLTSAGGVGVVIGAIALLFPTAILAGKGVAPEPATAVWVRELGINILALSVMVLLVRRHADAPTLRAVLWGNALVHAGLFPIEIAAFHAGVITRIEGIVPNSILHVLLAAGFLFFAGGRTRDRVVPREE